MLYAYDTEFLEDGKMIHLISIGIVCEDGREYYAVNLDMPKSRIHQRDWLMDNVWPHLPLKGMSQLTLDGETRVVTPGELDEESEFVKPKWVIRNEVRAFFQNGAGQAELWADYGAYDHVALAQLFGMMIDLPDGIPMHTNDLQTLLRLRMVDEPAQVGTGHNALDDARTVMSALQFLLEPKVADPPKEKGLAERLGEGILGLPDEKS